MISSQNGPALGYKYTDYSHDRLLQKGWICNLLQFSQILERIQNFNESPQTGAC